jgi:hypothetical protein
MAAVPSPELVSFHTSRALGPAAGAKPEPEANAEGQGPVPVFSILSSQSQVPLVTQSGRLKVSFPSTGPAQLPVSEARFVVGSSQVKVQGVPF